MRQFYHFTSFSLLLLAFMFGSLGLKAQETVTYNDAWGSEGYSVISQKSNVTVINYSITNFTLSEADIKGEKLTEITIPGDFLPNNHGAPDLPGSGRFFAIPQGAVASVNIISARKERYENVEMAPAPVIPWDDENKPLVYERNEDIYTVDAFYPANPVILGETTQIRGVNALMVGVTPFQYNPISKELIVYRDIQFEVVVEGGKNIYCEDGYRSRYWDPILSDMLLNYNNLPKIDYNKRYTDSTKDETGCEYLIVSPNGDDFTAWADTIRRFRNKQGVYTKIVTLEEIGSNTANGLEDYFDDIYQNWDIKPAAVLLLGDYGTDAETQITSPIWDNYCVSDNIFADVSGNDMPDIIFARITARDAEELQIMIEKFINYEKNPPTAENFYNHPITALGWQTERWFQICSEVVGGFLKEGLGKEPVRINAVYIGDPTTDPWSTATNTYSVTSYFGPNGLDYIPQSPSELGGWSGGTAQQVVNAINDGSFMLQHRDHGSVTGWGEPGFNTSNINSLTNTDLTFIFSINCLTGKYNNSTECFAEKFHRHAYGSLGLIAASEVSYSFVNDVYVWGLYDNLWPDFMPENEVTPEPRGILPAFGNAAGKYFLKQSGWPYNTNNKEVTYNLFHHHGGAFQTVYSEIPQDLTVAHNPVLLSGLDYFDVTADEGALIAISYDGEILGSAIATGSVVSVPIAVQLPGIYVDIVITKQNYFRYEQAVQVIPPDGAYILEDAFVVNDENENNQIDYNESILLDVTMKNVGSDDGNDITVTLSSSDSYITITNAVADFGTIPAEGNISLTDAFAFEVANNIPDQHEIVFVLTSTDGTDTWESTISVVANAPVLSIERVEILDASGNGNGMLDPGETVDLMIYTKNSGHSISPEAFASISSTNEYLTINSFEYEVGTIAADESQTAQFNITIDPSTPIAEYINFAFALVSGEYGFVNNINKPVGLLVEDWESGDFANFEWEFMGDENWIVSDEIAYEGMYSLKSGAIGDGDNTRIYLTAEVMTDDTISFYFKTSSELNRDFLRFYIDTNIDGIWSGENDWQKVSYAVTAGEHTFTWIYQKNGSEVSGSDAAWIDWIVLPPIKVTSASAGADTDICGAQPVQLNGIAANYETLEWTTAGDGSFSDASIINPVYTPGSQDIENEIVILSLTAHGSSTDVTDNMELTISTNPILAAGDDLQSCGQLDITIDGAAAENFAAILWATSGDGTFNDATLLNPTYMPGTEDLASGQATLSVVAQANGSCEDATDEINITLFAIPTAVISGEDMMCMDAGTTLTIDLTGTAPWNINMGELGQMDIQESPYYLDVNPTATTDYVIATVTDANNCVSSDAGVAHNIEVIDNPVVNLGNDTTICHNHTLTLNAGIDNAEYNWSTGETTSAIDVTLEGVAIGESKNISLEVTSEYGCKGTDDILITFKDCTGIGELSKNITMEVYPNPTTESFNLIIEGKSSEKVDIIIVNTLGEVMSQSGEFIIDGHYSHVYNTSNLENGIYFIRINGENGTLTQRFIKQ